ncbi:Putative cell wall binding repeat 2 [Microbacterium sp. cf046]|nr:Putative cell wall binding repeat 2 [Microbacterium sp. cf046]
MRLRARLGMVAGASIVMSSLVFAPPAIASTIEPGSTTTVAALLDDLRVTAPSTSTYDRDLFYEGQDADGDGCRTRQEVLLEETIVPATITDTCTVTTGEWYSYYDGATHLDATLVEMDHLVALKETWVSGADAWSDAQRTAYANETDFAATLVIVTAAVNTAKSDKDPAGWLPPVDSARCRYMTDWVTVKWRWNLAVDSVEKTAIQDVLAGCGPIETPAPALPLSGQPADPVVGSVTEIAPFGPGITRLSGLSRYETAIQVSQRYSPGVPAVFVATGTNFPDALSAAAAAAFVGGPLLLTPSDSLPETVLGEIQRLAPAKIYVIGGAGAVSPAIVDAFKIVAPTERLEGSDRYATGRKIVSSIFPGSATVFLATGTSFPDALAATGAAGKLTAPVLLVPGTTGALDTASLGVISDLGASDIVIAGGTGVVSAGIETQLASQYSVSRYGGATRYDTTANLNNAFFAPGSSANVFLATGANFPDALAGAALAGRLGAPLYISTAPCVPGPIRESIAALGASNQIIMGGPAVVSDAAASNTGCMSPGAPTISGTLLVGSSVTANPGVWTAGTTHTYQWYANGAPLAGATGSALALTTAHAGKRISVVVTGTKVGYLEMSVASQQTAPVGYPSRTTPIDSWTCPAWAPIKGNANSMIYHVPSGQYYAATNPEECFTTEAAAVAAGYRKSQR